MSDEEASQAPMSLPMKGRATVYELSSDAWKCTDQREAECVAVRACVAYARYGTPVGHNGAIAVRLDHVRNRFFCIVRANQFLVRLRIVEGRVVAIKSVRIANLP